MTHPGSHRFRRPLAAALALLASLVAARHAAAQFSAREGFSADGMAHWSFEFSPYLFLPNVNATIGLNRPPGFDVSVNRSRPTIVKVASVLNGAFVGYSVVRHGNWSGELDMVYVSVSQNRSFPPVLPRGPGVTLNSSVSAVLVSPGIGYQVLPTDASSKLALDARVGFSYHAIDASTGFARSPLGGVSYTNDFAQPWVGARLSYYPTPRWRLAATAALTGLGVDGGRMGWNARAMASYLVTSWFDVSLGYAALQVRRDSKASRLGEDRSLNLLAFGPVAAIGFRF